MSLALTRRSKQMPDARADPMQTAPDGGRVRWAVRPVSFTVLVIVISTVAGIGGRYWVRGDFDVIHALLILFFSTNLWISYWEICLYFKRDHIERRAAYWRRRRQETDRTPAVEFLTGKVPLAKMLSPALWADVWATYAQIDGSYADRRTYGYIVDIGNGFLTPVPTLVLYAAFTFDFLPAPTAGIIGVMLFWQLTFGTSLYWVSFFLAKRHTRLSRREICIYIWTLNSPWLLFALLGLHVSIRLIVDGDYSVLGY